MLGETVVAVLILSVVTACAIAVNREFINNVCFIMYFLLFKFIQRASIISIYKIFKTIYNTKNID